MLTSFVPLAVFAMITQTTFTTFMSYPAVPGNSDSFGGASREKLFFSLILLIHYRKKNLRTVN